MATLTKESKGKEDGQAGYPVLPHYQDMITTLPRERGWETLHIYQWQGFWLPLFPLLGALATQNHFQSLPTDILQVSSLKSGTVWLKSLIFSIVNRTSYPPFSPQHPLLTTNPHQLIPTLELNVYAPDKPITHITTTIPSPRLFGTHLPYQLLPESVKGGDHGCRIVYLCRNPKDVFISLWHFTKKLRSTSDGPPLSMEEAIELFSRGVSTMGPYWEHVLGYWEMSLERPEKILFLKYEDLQGDASTHLKKMAGFLGLPFTMEEEEKGVVEEIVKMCSFENLSNLEVNKSGVHRWGFKNNIMFRRGVIGDWENHLTCEMAERIDEITRQKLYGSGLTL